MSAPDGEDALSCEAAVALTAEVEAQHASSSYRAVNTPAMVGQQPKVIDIQDPSRVLECANAERQLRFQHLVRHYLSQILYGCTNPSCSTRTCLSSIERNATRPVRPPTQLTARTLAHHLAAEEDAVIGLCPHKLKVLPSSFRISDPIDATAQHGHGQSDSLSSLVGKIIRQKQAKKDTKSLSQNLFDSTSLMQSLLTPFASPVDVLDNLRRPHVASQSSNAKCEEFGSNHASRAVPSLRSNPCGGRPNSPGAHVTNLENVVKPDQSEHFRDQQSGPRHPERTCEVSDTQHQIHRIPFDLSTPPIVSRSTAQSRSRVDGAADSPKMTISKTGRKSFTLSGHAAVMHPSTTVQPLSARDVGRMSGNAPHAVTKIPALDILTSKHLVELKEQVQRRRMGRGSNQLDHDRENDASQPSHPAKLYVDRSLFYVFSNPESLLKSFHENNKAFASSPLPHLDSAQLVHAFRDWQQYNGALIFDSLSTALDALFIPPPFLQAGSQGRTAYQQHFRASDNRRSDTERRYLKHYEAAHIIMVCIHALTSLVEAGRPHTWVQVRKLRSFGVMLPDARPNTNGCSDPYIKIFDDFEYEPALRLADKLMRGISARNGFEMIRAKLRLPGDHAEFDDEATLEVTAVDIVLSHLHLLEVNTRAATQKLATASSLTEDPGWTVTATFIEWLKTVIMKHWDGKGTIHRWSSVGACLDMLKAMYSHFMSPDSTILIWPMFDFPFLKLRLDAADECLVFSKWGIRKNHFHILEHSYLFQQSDLVEYFRIINFNSMLEQYNHTSRTQQLQGSLDIFLRDPHRWLLRNQLKTTLSEYFVLDVSREDTIKDTLDQLWRVEKRMLLKPLKVKMGKNEGEVGLDHGGVTYEFFRMVLSEAFDPRYGMFTVDKNTRMTWFQPKSLEPNWKFEMIGIIFSLAIYNGITLPVTFPLAFYEALLHSSVLLRETGLPRGTDSIKDGWPEVARSLEQLRTWTDGDVGDTIMREYSFSYNEFGHHADHDMSKPYAYLDKLQPGQNSGHIPPTEETPLVTNANREQFVADYITHLTLLSVEPQILAFKEGFNTCLNSRSLHLFSSATLRDLVEGTTTISVPSLRAITRYENGYHATHSTILDFWAYVESLSQDDALHLLEFVTASDRIPITGYESISFVIVRVGTGTGEGKEKEKLPSSSTCFGKLYLPEYAGREILEKKVGVAIRNCRGFGVV